MALLRKTALALTAVAVGAPLSVQAFSAEAATIAEPTGALASSQVSTSVSDHIARRMLDKHPVSVSAGETVRAELRWSDRADLNLSLLNADGRVVAASNTVTPGDETPWGPHHEVVELQAATAGTYQLRAFSVWGSVPYTMEVTVTSPATAPGPVDPPPVDPGPVDPPPVDPGPVDPPVTEPLERTFGVWGVENENNVHKYTLTEALQHARANDFISAVPWSYRGMVPAMKQVNPDLKVVTYMNGTMAYRTERDAFPASWYLRDAKGNKIVNNWGVWLMDPANPGWVANRIAKCQENIRVEGSDGCYIDNLGHGTIWPSTLSGRPINPRTKALYTEAGWLADSSRLLDSIHGSLPASTVLFGNGLMNGSTYFRPNASASRMLFPSLDIGCSETFNRIAHDPLTKFRGEIEWKQDVDMLVDAGAQNRRVAAVTKVWVPATQAEYDALHEYALATFLLGDNGHHFFSFSSGGMATSKMEGGKWDVRIGKATGAYTKAGAAYTRDFEGGKVLVNPTSSPVTVLLDGTYTGLDGAAHTGTVTLQPHTGEILKG